MTAAMPKTVSRISFVGNLSRNKKPSVAMNKRRLRVPLIWGVAGAEVWAGSGMSLDSV
jgi:hypothetical protein